MNKILLSLLPVAFLGLIIGSNDPVLLCLKDTFMAQCLCVFKNGNSIIFNISCGYIISISIWYLVVFVPEKKKRNIIKSNIGYQYTIFKENTISNLLYAAGEENIDDDLVNKLLNHNEFKSYFDENNGEKWYASLKGLDENKRHIHDIHNDMNLLYNNITYVLNNVGFTDAKSHAKFILLQENIYRLLNHNDCPYDHVRGISGFLYSLLASWSFAEGKMSVDIVQEMIDQI